MEEKKETTTSNNENNGDPTTDGEMMIQSSSNRRRRLQFDPTVRVHPIPSHVVYSQRVRHTIWTGADELAENVARNSLEFSYEDWDSQKVVDEDYAGCLVYDQGGQWIHPVHFELSPPGDEPVLSSSDDEIWKQTCERLGIQPAEYYHSIQGPLPSASSDPAAET